MLAALWFCPDLHAFFWAERHPRPLRPPLHANTGMSEPRGRLARWSVSLRAVLAASLGAHRKAQHARVCFAGGRYFSSYRIDGTYAKSLRRVGSARGCSEASDISHRGCSEASRRRSCLRKPGGSSRMALGRAGGHVQCRARGGGGIARARSRLASSGCQGKISNHLLYRRSYT